MRALAQRDPLVEYQREGFDMFAAMMEGIKEESVGYLFNLEVQVEQQVEEVPVADGNTIVMDKAPEDARPEIRAKGLEAPQRPDRLHYTAPSVDGEGGVIEGDFATGDGGLDDGADDGADEESGTRAERRKAAKGRRRKK